MSLISLEKKIHSELTTKINFSRIKHDQLEVQINKESLLDVVIFLKKNNFTKFRQLIDITQRLEVVTEQLRLFLRELPPSEGERPPHY